MPQIDKLENSKGGIDVAYISNSVGVGGQNLVTDVKAIQWMLNRAQSNYTNVIFRVCYIINESGVVDTSTESAIKDLIAYRKKVAPKTDIAVLAKPIGGNALESTKIFTKSVISPNDDDYKYLLKCTLKPVCLTPNGLARLNFHSDSLITQALAGRISFEQFKKAAVAMDDVTCEDKNSSKNETNPYYTIDKGIVLEAEAISVLNKIATLYFKKVGKKFNVNSGTRTAARQADAMYGVYVSGDKTFKLYRNRKAANQLVAIIKNGQKKGKSKNQIVSEMTTLIQNYAQKNVFMSRHQRAGAIDISVRGDVGVPPMSLSEQRIMLSIATKVTGIKAIREEHPPHIHITFK